LRNYDAVGFNAQRHFSSRCREWIDALRQPVFAASLPGIAAISEPVDYGRIYLMKLMNVDKR
jgi:hypothetical protein